MCEVSKSLNLGFKKKKKKSLIQEVLRGVFPLLAHLSVVPTRLNACFTSVYSLANFRFLICLCFSCLSQKHVPMPKAAQTLRVRCFALREAEEIRGLITKWHLEVRMEESESCSAAGWCASERQVEKQVDSLRSSGAGCCVRAWNENMRFTDAPEQNSRSWLGRVIAQRHPTTELTC